MNYEKIVRDHIGEISRMCALEGSPTKQSFSYKNYRFTLFMNSDTELCEVCIENLNHPERSYETIEERLLASLPTFEDAASCYEYEEKDVLEDYYYWRGKIAI